MIRNVLAVNVNIKIMRNRKNDLTQIWFLTAIACYKIEEGPRGCIKTDARSRTFGYYRGWQAALTAVRENRYDMHECLYNYLVMERI